MSSAISRAVVALLAGSGLCGTAHADRPVFGAGINAEQVADLQFSGAGENVTYTEVSGNVLAQINNRRITVTGIYRLSYRLPELGDLDKSFNQDGVMRAQAKLIDEWVTLDGGVLVTRSRVDAGGAAPQINSANAKNLTQTYSAFIQPTLAHKFGDLGFAATYRYGYTKNEGRETGLATSPLSNRFDESKVQQATASVAMQQSSLPFDWTASVEYARENVSNLAEHTRSFNAVGEIVVPVGRSFAVVTSGGYERIRISERAALADPSIGIPVRDSKGRFLVDPASPRTITYDMSGLITDGGVIWKPGRRTRLEARAGYRYGGLSVTGLFEMKPSQRSGLTLAVTDRIQSFGQGLSGGLAASPANLDLGQSSNPDSAVQNCLFGKGAGTGQCIGGSVGQASASSYRERAGNIMFSHQMRRWNFTASAGYSRRTYIDTPGTLFSLDGVVDQIYFSELSMSGVLTRKSGLSFSFRGNLFKNGQIGAPDAKSGSFATNYYRSFGRGIRMQANFAVEASKQDGITADVSGRAQLGLQYQF